MDEGKKSVTLVNGELKKRLGGCADCGWKRGDPQIIQTGGDMNPNYIARIRCKAVANAQEWIRPISAQTMPNDCERRQKELRKRKRDIVAFMKFLEGSGQNHVPAHASHSTAGCEA